MDTGKLSFYETISSLQFAPSSENNPEKLYTPQDAIAFEHRDFAEEKFGFDPRIISIYAEVSNSADNILTKSMLSALLDIWKIAEDTTVDYEGTTYTYAMLCSPARCIRNSVRSISTPNYYYIHPSCSSRFFSCFRSSITTTIIKP